MLLPSLARRPVEATHSGCLAAALLAWL